jgi:hypothetical protein
MEIVHEFISSSITAFLTGVLSPVAVMLISRYITYKRRTKDPLREAAEHSEIICKVMDTIMEEISCDRVWIEQFHNGGHFYPTGKSIQKFSMIYETVSKDTFSVRHNFQNIPINLFSRSINQLLVHDKIIITDYKDDSISTFGLRYMAEETDCKSSYIFALKSIDGKMIGIIGIEYTKRKKLLSDELYNGLKLHTVQVATLLDTFLHKK